MARKRRNRRTPSGQVTANAGGEVTLPRRNVAGKVRSNTPTTKLDKGQTLRNNLSTYVQEAISQVRNRANINDIIKVLAREDGLFSNALNSMVALASQSGFRVAGYDASGAMDLQAMSVGYAILDRFDTLHDYTKGYNDRQGIRSLLNTLQTETIATGGCGVELVLDKQFTAERLVPISYSSIEWKSNGKGARYPTQDSGKIKLNIPTVFISEHNRRADEGYAVSMLRPGLEQVVQFNEFLEDMHRAINRVGHSRLIATLVAEKVVAAMPMADRGDSDKVAAAYEAARQQVETALSGLEPEDAIVGYDTVEYTVEDTGGTKSDYTGLLATLGNLTGAALKTPASVSGLRASGGQGLSNAETLMYLKVVEGARSAVQEVMSRALTLAIRLLGIDGYCKFSFMPINLRPEDELEAYRGTRQNRILTLLSVGMVNDAEACWELGIRPNGLSKLLSGTGFYEKSNSAGEAERESSTGRSLNPGTPSKSGGADQ